MAAGPDATLLAPGQLVLIDVTVRGRDDPQGSIMLFGTHAGLSAGSQKLMMSEWRDATFAEFAKVPLENCHVLDEAVLVKGKLGYKVEELTYMLRQLVPMGGLVDLDVKPGERVIVAPATGQFGGAAVEVALALGARVIAVGRDRERLARMKEVIYNGERLEVVKITGDVKSDTEALMQFGEVDKYIDFSPAGAAKSTHIMSCLMALKSGGMASLMGGIQETVAIPYGLMMFKSLQLRGKFMYERDAIKRLIKMVESGLLKLGEAGGLKVVGPFALEDWEEAFDQAEKNAGWGVQVIISP